MHYRKNSKVIGWLAFSYNWSTVSIHANSNEISAYLNMREANNEEVLDSDIQQMNIHDIKRNTKNKTDNEIKGMINKSLSL